MTTVVLLRCVPDVEALVEPRPLVVDGPSLVALGLGVSWEKANGGGVIGIAAGPAGWEPALREALALDLDALVRISTPSVSERDAASGGEDIVATAAALRSAIPAGASLVVAGAAATDHGSGLLPAALAEFLGWPLISSVTSFEAHQGEPAVRVRGEAGVRRLLGLSLPCVLVAAAGPAPNVYPRLAKKLAARKALIPDLKHDSGAARLRLDGYGPARPVTRTLFRPSTTARPAERMRQLMAGGMPKRSGQTLAADAGVAGQLADVLEAHGLIGKS